MQKKSFLSPLALSRNFSVFAKNHAVKSVSAKATALPFLKSRSPSAPVLFLCCDRPSPTTTCIGKKIFILRLSLLFKHAMID